MRRLFERLGMTEPGPIASRSELERALVAWREAPGAPERLEPGTRARIVHLARRPAGTVAAGPLPSLFPTGARLALAAVVPALALTVTLGYLARPVLGPAGDAPVRIQATKVGGEVVFEIANGARKHRVTRISRPGAEEDREVLTTRGAFRDRLESGADLVMYRVE